MQTQKLRILLAGLGLFFLHEITFAQTQLPLSTSNAAFQVLVFSKATDYRHDAITNGIAAIKTMGALNNFAVVATEDARAFAETNLAGFEVVVFLLTSGDVLDANQKAAFQRFIQAGNGFVGIHSASATEMNWPWYIGLVGAALSNHSAVVAARIQLEDANHPSTDFLPQSWTRTDEWFNYSSNPRSNVRVLLRLDESSYTGGTMGDHPIAWCHEYEGGRAWFTGLGHADTTYNDPLFRRHLLGGIQYASGGAFAPPPGARMLFDGTNTTEWVQSSGSAPIPWPIVNQALQTDPAKGNIQTVETCQDFRLHVEFSIPPSAPGTAEGSLGNSGIYLQRRYEIQIMESYGRPISGSNESGALYGLRDPSSNASVPTGKWETFDIIFQAARWAGNVKTASALLTLYWNTVLVQNNVSISTSTGGGDAEGPSAGPIQLQALVGAVKFRNLWVQGTIANPPSLKLARNGQNLLLSWPIAPGGFQVQSRARLDTPWTPVFDLPAIIDQSNILTRQGAGATEFFRLFRSQ